MTRADVLLQRAMEYADLLSGKGFAAPLDWTPGANDKERVGSFRRVLDVLNPGDVVRLPGGTEVTRLNDGDNGKAQFEIHGMGETAFIRGIDKAQAHAFDCEACSRHPESFGGSVAYPSYAQFMSGEVPEMSEYPDEEVVEEDREEDVSRYADMPAEPMVSVMAEDEDGNLDVAIDIPMYSPDDAKMVSAHLPEGLMGIAENPMQRDAWAAAIEGGEAPDSAAKQVASAVTAVWSGNGIYHQSGSWPQTDIDAEPDRPDREAVAFFVTESGIEIDDPADIASWWREAYEAATEAHLMSGVGEAPSVGDVASRVADALSSVYL